MAITTHAELLTAISDYIGKRSDLGSVDDDFIVLVEARLNYGSYDPQFSTPALRTRQMEARTDLSPTSEYVSLPTDFLAAKYAKVTSTNPERLLKSKPAATFDRNLSNSSSGRASYYSIVGTELRVNPPMTSGTIELLYYQAIPALGVNSTNWLLTANPALYLYGGLMEAALYVDELEDILKYSRMFSGLVLAMNASGSDSSRGGPLEADSGVRLPQSSVVRI